MPVKTILLIEDDDLDARLMQQAFAKEWPEAKLVWADSGERGLDIISQSPPDLVLLDISMPGIDGFETLTRVSENSLTRKLPVIICSGATAKSEIRRGYDGAANAYLAKPSTLEGYFQMLSSLKRFWSETALLPQ